MTQIFRHPNPTSTTLNITRIPDTIISSTSYNSKSLPRMPIKITQALDTDAQRAFEIENAAYAAAADPVSPLLFPGPHDPNGVTVRAASLLQQKHADPTTIWLKAVDDETGELIGFAEWHVYEPGEPIPKPPVRDWGPGSNPEVCEEFFGEIAEGRERVMGGKGYVCKFT
jgi:hypothetical protein